MNASAARLAAALCAALCACGRRGAEVAAAPPDVVVAFSGEDLGRFEPCGCTSGMLGGLARRGARIRASAVAGVPTVFVAGGPLVAGADRGYDLPQLRTFLRALRSMDCAAFAPSSAEFAFGIDAVAAAARDAGVPAASANVATGGALRRVVKVAAGRIDVYVAGLVAKPRDVAGLVVSDPRRALREVRAEVLAGAPLVVLFDADEPAARAVAEGIAGPTLVCFAGGRTDPRDEDATSGAVAFAPYPSQGKFVGFAALARGAWSVEYRPVVRGLPEDPFVVDLRSARLAQLRAAGIVAARSGDPRFAVAKAPPAGDRFVGNAECASCHVEAVQKWTASRHAKALDTLRATGDDADPGCVRCHVVGYGTARGFVDEKRTPLLEDVGCGACHGARGRHVDARRKLETDAGAAPVDAAGCLACHDGEHDPNFDFAPYWKRIEHGAK